MPFKVLITSPKRKDKLVQAFKDAGAEVVTELTDDVKMIVPTVDEELPFFSQNKKYFEERGIRVCVSDETAVYLCRDKAEFNRVCHRHGVATPKTINDELIIKPRFGKGSKGITRVGKEMLVQEYIPFTEYSVDYLGDWNGKCISAIPRQRLCVVNGESTNGLINYSPDLREQVVKLAEELKLKGPNTIQGWFTGKTFIFNEINCRFGGGFWITRPVFDTVAWLIKNSGVDNVHTGRNPSLRHPIS